MYVVAALGLLYAKPGQASKDPQLPPKEPKLLPQSILTESFSGSLCSTVLFRNKNFSLFSPKKYSLGWNWHFSYPSQLLSAHATMYKKSNFLLLLFMKIENVKKISSGYFSKINFSITSLTAQKGPKLLEIRLKKSLNCFIYAFFYFPLIYQFYSIMTTLFRTTCWNPADLFILKSFHQHFKKFW